MDCIWVRGKKVGETKMIMIGWVFMWWTEVLLVKHKNRKSQWLVITIVAVLLMKVKNSRTKKRNLIDNKTHKLI